MNGIKLGLIGLVLVILNCLDMTTTIYALGQGFGVEANPLVNFGPIQILFKLFLPLMFVLPLIAAHHVAIKEHHSKMATGLCILLFGVTSYLLAVIVSNLMVIARGLGYV